MGKVFCFFLMLFSLLTECFGASEAMTEDEISQSGHFSPYFQINGEELGRPASQLPIMVSERDDRIMRAPHRYEYEIEGVRVDRNGVAFRYVDKRHKGVPFLLNSFAHPRHTELINCHVFIGDEFSPVQHNPKQWAVCSIRPAEVRTLREIESFAVFVHDKIAQALSTEDKDKKKRFHDAILKAPYFFSRIGETLALSPVPLKLSGVDFCFAEKSFILEDKRDDLRILVSGQLIGLYVSCSVTLVKGDQRYLVCADAITPTRYLIEVDRLNSSDKLCGVIDTMRRHMEGVVACAGDDAPRAGAIQYLEDKKPEEEPGWVFVESPEESDDEGEDHAGLVRAED